LMASSSSGLAMSCTWQPSDCIQSENMRCTASVQEE
jgi:hypothetical protein